MLNWIKSTFSRSKHEYTHSPLMPRIVNISGTVFHFSMPENFSLDMPANDLVDRVDLENSDIPEDGAIQLMKRWWDFYHGKPAANNVTGTVMLSLDILPRKPSIEGSLFDHKPMVETVFHDILADFSVDTPEEALQENTVLPASASQLDEFAHNGRNQVIIGIGYLGREANRVNIYSTPISDNWYIRAWFSLSTAGGKNSDPFLHRALGEQMRILESFTLAFPFDIPEREPVEKTLDVTPLSKKEQEAFIERNKKHYME